MNKTALITGASKRIGKAISEHLAHNGWNIIIHYNTSEKVAINLSEELSKKFPLQIFPLIKADLSQPAEVQNIIPASLNKIKHLDLLINNASVFDQAYIHETSAGLFDIQMNVNLRAPFILGREFMVNCKKGNIINLVDTRITNNMSDYAAYSLSKKGLWELTKMAAIEMAPDIRVNAIAPGVTLAPEDKDDSYLLGLAENIPMQKPGGIQPILQSIDYILENEHLTGQLLFADGGENLGKSINKG